MSFNLVSLVPPLFGLVGGALAGFYSARAALRSWERSRQDLAAKQAVDLIRELGTELARAHHSMCWVTWKAKFDPDGLTMADIERYDSEMHASLPKFSGDFTALAGIDWRAAEKLSPTLTEIYALDARVGMACVEFRAGNAGPLAELHDEAVSMKLLEHLKDMAADVLGNRTNVKFND